MPWARAALAPIVGGADRVTCETCHGARRPHAALAHAGGRRAADAGRQRCAAGKGSGGMDAQMRNAIYGYIAESDKQAKAAYMREVVMPGMARCSTVRPYDFTRPYDYNRSRLAFGCYHCHQVK